MRKFLLFSLFCSLCLTAFSQQILEGYALTDEEDLPGTVVYNSTHQAFAVTDEEGWFSISAEIGDRLSFTRLGYQTLEIELEHPDDIADVFMKAEALKLPTAVVSAYKVPNRICCVCGCRYSLPKGEKVLEMPSPTTVMIRAFPNPTIGVVTIEAAAEVEKAELIGANGALIKSYDLHQNHTIDLSNCPAGQYWLRCYSEEKGWFGIAPIVKVD